MPGWCTIRHSGLPQHFGSNKVNEPEGGGGVGVGDGVADGIGVTVGTVLAMAVTWRISSAPGDLSCQRMLTSLSLAAARGQIDGTVLPIVTMSLRVPPGMISRTTIFVCGLSFAPQAAYNLPLPLL